MNSNQSCNNEFKVTHCITHYNKNSNLHIHTKANCICSTKLQVVLNIPLIQLQIALSMQHQKGLAVN
jgi:hypothetical protein